MLPHPPDYPACLLQFVKRTWGYTGEHVSMPNYIRSISYGSAVWRPEDNIVVGPINLPCEGYTNRGLKYNSLSCDDNALWGWWDNALSTAQVRPAARCSAVRDIALSQLQY